MIRIRRSSVFVWLVYAAGLAPVSGAAEKVAIISSPESYAAAFNAKRKDAKVSALCGRIIRGTDEKEFTLLGEPSRKIVFFMDASGLEGLLGLSGRQILEKIGYTHDYIARLLEKKTRFKLVIFSDAGSLRPATWRNVVQLLGEVYPAGVRAKIAPMVQSLEDPKNSYEQIDAAGRFREIDKAGPASQEFLTVERFLAIPEPTLTQVRAFLYYNLRLTELFTGTGYTAMESNRKSSPEFIGANRKISDIAGAKVIDLPVEQ